RDLNTLQHGAYLLLIMHYWQHDALPSDDARLPPPPRASVGAGAGLRAPRPPPPPRPFGGGGGGAPGSRCRPSLRTAGSTSASRPSSPRPIGPICSGAWPAAAAAFSPGSRAP